MLLERSLDASPMMSCRFCAWGVRVSRLYLTGLTLVEMGGGPVKVGDCARRQHSGRRPRFAWGAYLGRLARRRADNVGGPFGGFVAVDGSGLLSTVSIGSDGSVPRGTGAYPGVKALRGVDDGDGLLAEIVADVVGDVGLQHFELDGISLSRGGATERERYLRVRAVVACRLVVGHLLVLDLGRLGAIGRHRRRADDVARGAHEVARVCPQEGLGPQRLRVHRRRRGRAGHRSVSAWGRRRGPGEEKNERGGGGIHGRELGV